VAGMKDHLGSNSKEAHPRAAPSRWPLSFWARGYRRLARPWVVTRHVQRFCDPFTVDGAEHLLEITGPALIVANHTSHFDTVIVLSLLPGRLYHRVAVAAAADRFYTDVIKSAWFSLRYNTYPIARGGGSAALAHSEWLLQHGWSLLLFPEGRRSRTGELLPFHPGPAILALRQRVPVLPLHISGAAEILRPGTRRSQPAAVRVRVGPALSLGAGMDVGAATSAIEEAVRTLAQPREAPAASRAAPVPA
jgi:1-acyl-sn-glycerol-3-phosphate acyltransferase